VFADLFSRHDISGWGKGAWIVFVIILPYLGVLIYLIAEHGGMTERAMKKQQAQQAAADQYIRSVSGGGPAGEINTAKNLLDSGAITQAEYDSIKAKALASS
jgi:membrane protease subunit (stomatin/prohibitin family)